MPENRRKELKELYKQRKPDMGVFWLRNTKSGRCFLEGSTDINSMFTRIRFQLDMGVHPNPELQQDWKSQGEAQFAFEVLDKLAYSKDESKTDYRDEIKLLKTIWLEKLKADNPDISFY